MARIKILLSSRPELLSEVLRNLINSQSDMEIVVENTDPLQLLLIAKETEAHAVIIAPIVPNGEPKLCHQLLLEHPKLVIMTMDADTKIAYVYRAHFPRQRVLAPSSQTILSILRGSWLSADQGEIDRNQTSR